MYKKTVTKINRTWVSCYPNRGPRKQYTSFGLVARKCCYLPGKLREHVEFVPYFSFSFLYVHFSFSKFSPFFSDLEPGARPKLAHAYYVLLSFCIPVLLGSIPELPAESCKEIKDSEEGQALSGEYWLNPKGSMGLDKFPVSL